MNNKIEIEPSVLRALFAPNASFSQRRDACDKARAAYEVWESAKADESRVDKPTSNPGADTPLCRGSTALGTACGKCARCLAPPGEVKFKGMIETACRTFAIMIDEANVHYGWTFQRSANGMWVSGRKATEAEMNAARARGE